MGYRSANMREFVPTKGLKNHRELLARERVETEYLYVLSVLTQNQAGNRRPSSADWVLKPNPEPVSGKLRDIAETRQPGLDTARGELPGDKMDRRR
jgi:hypothetical protein